MALAAWMDPDSVRARVTDEAKEWKHSGSLWINTTSAGADLPAGARVEQFPLLVRLHRDFFDFSQAQPGGEDVRFVSPDGVPLVHQIEEWNPSAGQASLWVRIPVIEGNSRQEIQMRWGNPRAVAPSGNRSVFDASNGYLGVWHMDPRGQDEVHGLKGKDTGTQPVQGLIGPARHFEAGQGISLGEQIAHFPTGSRPHTTEAWFRAKQPNSRILGWGLEKAQGKVVLQYRSPPHVEIDWYFSDATIKGKGRVPQDQWVHVAFTYERGKSQVFVNGRLDVSRESRDAPLALTSPTRMYLGGWYNHYDFVGDLDEVRLSSVVRSPEWLTLQFENQKPNQTLVGHLVRPGTEFSLSQDHLDLAEGQTATIQARADGAQMVSWTLQSQDQERVLSTGRFAQVFHAPRGQGDQKASLVFKAIYPDRVQTRLVPIVVREEIPEPEFTLSVPATWEGRTPIEVTPRIQNLPQMSAKGVDKLDFQWELEDVAVVKKVEKGKLILKRAQGNGPLTLKVGVGNGGPRVWQTARIEVQQSQLSREIWVDRPIEPIEQPEDHQFIPRRGFGRGKPIQGLLVYSGVSQPKVDSVFVRVYAGERLFATQTVKPEADGRYLLKVSLDGGLIKYRTEFGFLAQGKETITHTAQDIVCGDAFLIIGQSNAVATDFGKDNPLVPSEWVRTFGATTTDPKGARSKTWANAQARSNGGQGEIGYWGMELGRRLVESQKTPICIINGAVGGTRIDQHQRNDQNPTDPGTIYGRLLWRVREAKLTHGIRAILWHQGENDQGADGPTGKFGYETYANFFVDLAGSWKEDYPNVQAYYLFQIWPKACAMGVDGSDNRLREVQRTLPRRFSNLSVMSTVGVKPPGGCHFPAAGYAEFARLIHPMMRYQIYHAFVDSFHPPDLRRASFTSAARDEILLEFNSPILWSDSLVNQFHLEGSPGQVVSGQERSFQLLLKL